MARLPEIGSDIDNWGIVLNEFLRISHHEDGTLKGCLGVVNVKDYGAVGDGTTDDAAAIVAADAFATGEGGWLFFPPGIYLIRSNITIAVPVACSPGAILKPAADTKITIQKHIEAGFYQIFDLSLGGTIALTKLSASTSAPEHFGAVNEGAKDKDDSAPFQAWATAMTDSGFGVLKVRSGAIYRFGSTVEINTKSQSRIDFGGAKFVTENDIVLLDLNPEADPADPVGTTTRDVVADLGYLEFKGATGDGATAIRCLNFRNLTLRCNGFGFFRGVEFAGGDTYKFSCHFNRTRTHFFSPDWEPQIPGTVTVANGSTAVTGSGTSFTALAAGIELRFGDHERHYVIASVANDSHLTLTEPYDEPSGSGLTAFQSALPGGNTLSVRLASCKGGGDPFDVFLDMRGRWFNLGIDGGSMNGSPAVAGVRLSNAAGQCRDFFVQNFHTEQGESSTLFHFHDAARRGDRQFLGIVIIGGSFGDGNTTVFKMERCLNVDVIGANFAQTAHLGGVPIDLDTNCKNINISRSTRFSSAKMAYTCDRSEITFGEEIRPRNPFLLSGFQGESFSTGSASITMSEAISTIFPANIVPKGYLIGVTASDSGSAGSTDARVGLARSAAAFEDPPTRHPPLSLAGVPNGTRVGGAYPVMADSKGDIYVDYIASGTDTLNIWLSVIAILM